MKMFQKVVFTLVLCMCFSVVGFSQKKTPTKKAPSRTAPAKKAPTKSPSQQAPKKKTGKKKNNLAVREESVAFELVLIA